MKALVLTGDGLRFDAVYPDPKPRKNEAVVRVLKAGICGTDLEMLRGYKEFRGVPGHEFVGEVEWCGKRPELVGKRVVGEINVGCGKCDVCARGGWRHCAKREVLGILGRDGAFAERLSLPARSLHAVGDIAPETAVFAEPLAAALRVLEQVEVRAGTRIVVLGPGRLGRLVHAVLGAKSDDVSLVGRSDTPPVRADVVVDCTGSPDGFARALDIVRPLGTVILKSTCAGGAAVPSSILTEIVVNEVTVTGSRCGWNKHFEQAIVAFIGGSIDVAPLVAATYRLEDFERAFEHAARPGALKVLFDLA